MSSTGVPSIASRPRTFSSRPSIATSSQQLEPSRLGRRLARWAKIPTSGQSGLWRGRRASVWTEAGIDQVEDVEHLYMREGLQALQ